MTACIESSDRVEFRSRAVQYRNMPQVWELEVAAVTVRVAPEMLQAAAMAVEPCTWALQAFQKLEVESVTVQVVPADMEQVA